MKRQQEDEKKRRAEERRQEEETAKASAAAGAIDVSTAGESTLPDEPTSGGTTPGGFDPDTTSFVDSYQAAGAYMRRIYIELA